MNLARDKRLFLSSLAVWFLGGIWVFLCGWFAMCAESLVESLVKSLVESLHKSHEPRGTFRWWVSSVHITSAHSADKDKTIRHMAELLTLNVAIAVRICFTNPIKKLSGRAVILNTIARKELSYAMCIESVVLHENLIWLTILTALLNWSVVDCPDETAIACRADWDRLHGLFSKRVQCLLLFVRPRRWDRLCRQTDFFLFKLYVIVWV